MNYCLWACLGAVQFDALTPMMTRLVLWGGAVILAWSCGPSECRAGGGPENVVLVVNADSASSKLIANHYIAGRRIPARNVFYLNGIPAHESIELDIFRETILRPVLQLLEERKLANSVDYIVYSADFPTAINIKPHYDLLMAELKKNGQSLPANLFSASASINSLTFFAGPVMNDVPAYMLLDANTYYRHPSEKLLRQPFVGTRQEEFAAAIAKINQSEPEFQKGLKQLETLAEHNPRQVAVLYWLARFYAQSGDAKNATRWLTQAIRMGWSFREQTKADLSFDKVKNDPLFRGVVNRIPDHPFDFVPTRGFKQNYPWGLNGMLNNEPGQGNRYLLSTVLAVTRNYGNNEREALRQLKISMSADATHPSGTFYFSDTSDVRNATRKPNYKSAIDALRGLGQKSEIIKTTLPMQRRDVLGLSTGTGGFIWTESGSKIQPGSICENLTSYGGRMASDAQTNVAEFLRHDAAGASGTVTEPYAIQAKFPHPMIHAHYAAGCSLAEAFYQSVSGPFQLLIVGDALCQPWAIRPVLKVTGIAVGDKIKGTTKIGFDATESPVPIAGMEMYVDGVLVLRDRVRQQIAFDTSGISDGYHELRFVAIANNPIETTGGVIVPVEVDNGGFSTALTASRTDYLDTDTVTFQAKSNFGDSIELTHNMRSLAKKIGRDATFEIPATLLGRGPVAVEAIALDGAGKAVASVPLKLVIEGRLSEHNEMTERNK